MAQPDNTELNRRRVINIIGITAAAGAAIFIIIWPMAFLSGNARWISECVWAVLLILAIAIGFAAYNWAENERASALQHRPLR